MLNESSGRRRGFTLLELIVVMIVGGIALGLLAGISMRQQRAVNELADAAALSSQVHDAAAILPIDLRGASAADGDIREARDTAIELRTTIASAVICDTGAAALVLSPAIDAPDTYAGTVASIAVGDTAWLLVPGDSLDSWRPYRVASSGAAPAGTCLALGPRLSSPARAQSRTSLALAESPPLASLVGVPLRVTRPARYSLYRASDGAWYVGERDWNTSSARFNTIQPVSGPYLSALQGGLRFQYVDSSGRALASPVTDTRAIGRVRIDIRGQTRGVAQVLGAASRGGAAAPTRRTDSSSTVVLLRNR